MQISLCNVHKEIFKYFCFDCNEYFCSFCIKKNNKNHFCFSTLNISKLQFKELNSLIQLMNEEKELLNESKVTEVINELKDKKEKDLLMVYKFEESIKDKYDTMINFLENLKNRINEFKNSINQSFLLFKSEYNNNNNFEPNSLLQSIEQSFNETNELDFELK